MVGRPWTREDEDTIKRMAADKKTVKEIAKALDRTCGAVRLRGSSMGVRFIDPRTGTYKEFRKIRIRRVSDKILATIDPPKNVDVPQGPIARGVDWAV